MKVIEIRLKEAIKSGLGIETIYVDE